MSRGCEPTLGGSQLDRRHRRPVRTGAASACGGDTRTWRLGGKTTARLTSTAWARGVGRAEAGTDIGGARGCGVEAEPERNPDRLLPQHIVISLRVLLSVPARGAGAKPFQQARPSR
jgi:hypothetical protein